MNSKILACILAVFFIVLGLWMTKTAIGKKKWGPKRALLCAGALGGFAAGAYCVTKARSF